MLLTNLALFAAIGLAIAASAAYIVHRVRRVSREARLREQQRAAALLAEVSASRGPVAPAPSRAAAPDRLDDALSSFFPAATPPPTAPPSAEPVLTTCARDLAARLRAAADRIDQVAADPALTTQARSESIVTLATEATSPAALRPVIMAAHPAS